MTTFGRRGSFFGSGWIYWPLCLIACALMALAVLGPEAERRLELEQQCARMEAEVQSLTQARDQLQAARDALQQDPTYVQQVARHELGAVRPGEIRLPQPDEFASVRFQPPADPTPSAPPVLAFLASFVDSQMRLAALVVGSVFLGIAVVLSIPTAETKPSRA